MFEYFIVGTGFASSVLAERLAGEGKRIFLCDKRPHTGSNAYDYYDEAGLLVYRYGPHIFHTNSRLATYKHYNMDQVVAQALILHKKLSSDREVYPFHSVSVPMASPQEAA